MGRKMNATVVVAALVVVVVVASTSVLTAEASRLDLTSILGSIGIYQTDSLEVFDQENTYEKKKKGCCDMCLCTRSIPPQCQCTDIKASCHAQCKACRCTRSIPPQCRCMDINDFCYKKCPSSSTPSDEAAIGITN